VVAGLLSLPCTARGGSVVVLTAPDPAQLLEAIAKHRVIELLLPLTVIYRLLDIPDLRKKADFSSLSAPLPGRLARVCIDGQVDELPHLRREVAAAREQRVDRDRRGTPLRQHSDQRS